ncbi:MAG: right-handed parallel beta-helix repeat-containing protein [Fimbriimonadaceae bacterium]|nr:right-handed parallel beta-helix repeat-containing protein [Fimbriimonadaceae bacterium]
MMVVGIVGWLATCDSAPQRIEALGLKVGENLRPVADGKAAITITRDGTVLDLGKMVLRGSPAMAEPDERRGIGVEIRAKNVTIKNARIHGYQHAIVARGAEGLRIVGGNLSDNFRPRLKSGREKEDLADWMSFHQNERDEWMRFGAAILLDSCDRAEVRGVVAHRGINGLLMSRTNRATVWNCDFSGQSGLGVGMYRSSDNRLMHNRLDYCLRGFSYGYYNRGQDSAAILMFEQCHRNVVAYNSATHSGDGFFLWAGQSTMDTGKGGCNDNLLYGNDFSHAPTNGIEATFSRNTFADNLILECWHGVWGGYSYESKLLGNIVGYCTEGVAWEHGQQNLVRQNLFFRNGTDIKLWANATQDPNWGYPKSRDTVSRDWNVRDNMFIGTAGPVFDTRRTRAMRVGQNQYVANQLFLRYAEMSDLRMDAAVVRGLDGTDSVGIPPMDVQSDRASGTTGGIGETYPRATPAMRTAEIPTDDAEYQGRFRTDWNPLTRPASPVTVGSGHIGATPAVATRKSLGTDVLSLRPTPIPGGIDPFLKPGTRRGWATMIVDEWGPYLGDRPLLREIPAVRENTRRFEVLGPRGKWKVDQAIGVRTEASTGTVPGVVEVTYDGPGPERTLTMTYRGQATRDHRGVMTKAGRPVRLKWSEFAVRAEWDVAFYAWDPRSQDPRTAGDAFRKNPVITRFRIPQLDFAGYGRFTAGVPATHFATVAEATITLPTGEYEMEFTADDGLRVTVDGAIAPIDAWKYQGPTVYRVPISGGTRRVKVEHFQIDGYATLQVRFARKPEKSERK